MQAPVLNGVQITGLPDLPGEQPGQGGRHPDVNPLPLGEKEHPGGGPKVSHLPDNVCPETPGILEASTPLLVYL